MLNLFVVAFPRTSNTISKFKNGNFHVLLRSDLFIFTKEKLRYAAYRMHQEVPGRDPGPGFMDLDHGTEPVE